MRENLIKLAVRYEGDYRKIAGALSHYENADEEKLQDAITILDEDYPMQLLRLKKPPLVLFYKGNREILRMDRIAVVGCRNATEYGKECTKEIVNILRENYCIVSGLAKGIDSIAHKNATNTVAVIGNGLDVFYPYENKELQNKLYCSQLVLSEYPLGVKPLQYHFPFRNRIIAALSEGVIVTQANEHSGTMHTVSYAREIGIPIYSVVYPFNDPDGIGCNRLIEQGAMILNRENVSRIFDKTM